MQFFILKLIQVEKYHGPLLSLDQLKDPDEHVTDFLFTKYIMLSYAEAFGAQGEKGRILIL